MSLRFFTVQSNAKHENRGQFESRVHFNGELLRVPMGRMVRARFIENRGLLQRLAHVNGVSEVYGYLVEVYESTIARHAGRPQKMELRLAPSHVGMLLEYATPGQELVLETYRREACNGNITWYSVMINGQKVTGGDVKKLSAIYADRVVPVQVLAP